MSSVIDSTLWVDYFRAKTPLPIRERIEPWVYAPGAVLCNPIRFEILRAARRNERAGIEEMFATLPILPDPDQLWEKSARLGQKCLDEGFVPPSGDLLIATVCLEHEVELVTFDQDFVRIAEITELKVELLRR